MSLDFDELTKIVREYACELGLELIHLELKGSGSRLLRIIVDLPDNHAFSGQAVSVDICAKLSRRLDDYWEQDAELKNFNLEVSSPGLDRILKSTDDFFKHQGACIELKTREPESKFYKGLLLSVIPEQKLIVLYMDETEIEILVENVRQAKVDYFATLEWRKAKEIAERRKQKKQKR